MNLDWGSETVADVTGHLGRPPADVVSFVGFPLSVADATNLDAAARQARDARALLVVTLQPWDGLAVVTDDVARDLATRVAGYGSRGTPTLIRFAHEMNGSWYPWGQDPTAYVAAFRRVAAAIHTLAPTAAMLWAPNQGEGYPYRGGKYGAKHGTPAAHLLDTSGDGSLNASDDPYAPYWPGTDAVDWVGMSLYYWGIKYPWGANSVPAASRFSDLLASQQGASGSGPNFYLGYAARYDKPLAIVETAAFYRPAAGGPGEAAIKTAWLDEVFAANTSSRFPLLRIINWFEWRKFETEVSDVVDWRITANAQLRKAFLATATGSFSLGPAVSSPGCALAGMARPASPTR